MQSAEKQIKLSPEDLSNILVIIVAGIGDFIIAIPALRALRKSFSSSRITLLVSSKTLDYAAQCPYADSVLAMDSAAFFSPSSWCGLVAQWPVFRKLRQQKFSLAISFYEIPAYSGMIKLYALMKWIGAAYTAGRDTGGKGFFFDIKIPESYDSGLHQADYYAALARRLGGVAPEPSKDDLWTIPGAEAAVEKFMDGRKLPAGAPLIGINPGGARVSRYWPPERFAATADFLSEKYGATIIIIGGPGDGHLAEAVAARMKNRPLISAGKFRLAENLELIKMFDLLITTHSSLLHAANSLGVPHVALAGMTDPVRDGPYMPDAAKSAVIKGTAENDPAVADEDLPSSSMTAITISEVITAAETLLRNRGIRAAGNSTPEKEA